MAHKRKRAPNSLEIAITKTDDEYVTDYLLKEYGHSLFFFFFFFFSSKISSRALTSLFLAVKDLIPSTPQLHFQVGRAARQDPGQTDATGPPDRCPELGTCSRVSLVGPRWRPFAPFLSFLTKPGGFQCCNVAVDHGLDTSGNRKDVYDPAGGTGPAGRRDAACVFQSN
jgi:hypothetical protein